MQLDPVYHSEAVVSLTMKYSFKTHRTGHNLVQYSLFEKKLFWEVKWLRGPDLNRRPSGYEPDELPSCSTPRPKTWQILR